MTTTAETTIPMETTMETTMAMTTRVASVAVKGTERDH
jgi:hypothetical protein